jgi:hypothetical protein
MTQFRFPFHVALGLDVITCWWHLWVASYYRDWAFLHSRTFSIILRSVTKFELRKWGSPGNDTPRKDGNSLGILYVRLPLRLPDVPRKRMSLRRLPSQRLACVNGKTSFPKQLMVIESVYQRDYKIRPLRRVPRRMCLLEVFKYIPLIFSLTL